MGPCRWRCWQSGVIAVLLHVDDFSQAVVSRRLRVKGISRDCELGEPAAFMI